MNTFFFVLGIESLLFIAIFYIHKAYLFFASVRKCVDSVSDIEFTITVLKDEVRKLKARSR